MQSPFPSPFLSRRKQAAVEHSHLHDGVRLALCCLLVHHALAGVGGVWLRAPPDLLHTGLQQRGQVRAGAGPPAGGLRAQQSPAATQRRAGTRRAQPEAASSHVAAHRDGQRQLPLCEKLALGYLLLPSSLVIYNLHLWGFRTCSSAWLFLCSPALMSEEGCLGLEIKHPLWLSAIPSIPHATARPTFSKCWT